MQSFFTTSLFYITLFYVAYYQVQYNSDNKYIKLILGKEGIFEREEAVNRDKFTHIS